MNRVLSILVMLAFCAGCRGSAQMPEPASDFSPAFPKNYLIVHEGVPGDFAAAKCFDFVVLEDRSTPNPKPRLTALLGERLPQLKSCSNEWPRLAIEFRSGRGVSLHHAEADPAEPYSAFAFIALENKKSSDAQPDALAEWQYWRGGSSTLVMQQFVFDLTNLYINGMEKPVPNAR